MIISTVAWLHSVTSKHGDVSPHACESLLRNSTSNIIISCEILMSNNNVNDVLSIIFGDAASIIKIGPSL